MDEKRLRRTGLSGFTLMEVVVAVAILGVAISIFVSLYSGSLSLAETGKSRSIAVVLAEGQLNAILDNPDAFRWESGEGQVDIRLGTDDPAAGNAFSAPGALPPEARARDWQVNTYEEFRWQAFANPAESAPYHEVTLVVRWTEGGRNEVIALTSALENGRVPVLAAPVEQEEESTEEAAEAASEEAAA